MDMSQFRAKIAACETNEQLAAVFHEAYHGRRTRRGERQKAEMAEMFAHFNETLFRNELPTPIFAANKRGWQGGALGSYIPKETYSVRCGTYSPGPGPVADPRYSGLMSRTGGSRRRGRRKSDPLTHEIDNMSWIDADLWDGDDKRWSYSVLVHEMAHHADFLMPGVKPPDHGHSERWARIMKSIGLHPTSDGTARGKQYGTSRMKHIILPNGPYAQVYNAFVSDAPKPMAVPEPVSPVPMPPPKAAPESANQIGFVF